jgi:hypothetical protein
MSHDSLGSRVSRGSGFESLPMSITRAIFEEAQSPDGTGTGSRHSHHLSLPESTFQLDEETERQEWTHGAPSGSSGSPIEAKTFRVLKLLREAVEPGRAGEANSDTYTITTVGAPVLSRTIPRIDHDVCVIFPSQCSCATSTNTDFPSCPGGCSLMTFPEDAAVRQQQGSSITSPRWQHTSSLMSISQKRLGR